MDTATLVIADAVLRLKSVRAAARTLGKPPASIAAAMARIEAQLAMPLVQKTGSSLMLTLEGARLAPLLARLAALVSDLFAVAGSPWGAAGPMPRLLSLDALFRLLSVAETGSIRAAARGLGLGQPQLTRQISHVEAVLGLPVLARARTGAVPTPEGHRIIDTVRRIKDLWQDLAGASTDRFRRTEAVVRIGSVIPLGPDSHIAGLLADLAARWRRAHPRQPLFITSMIAEELLNALRRGQFDVTLLDVETLPDDLDGRLLSASPLALVGDAALIGRARDADPAAILVGHPVAIPSLRSGLRQTIDRVIAALLGPDGHKRIEIVEVDSIPVILNMVERHGFISVLPSVSLTLRQTGLRQIHLDPRHSLPLWIAWPKSRTGQAVPRQILSVIEA